MKKPTPKQRFHLSRLVLFSVLATAVLVAQGASTSGGLRLTYNKQQVLAYATNMNISDLITTANQSRAANGLGPLTLNTQLNTSAQLKANDMITNDYWAHVSPTGVQPWYWFEQASYSYASAGENLAYGFKTGTEVNTAWMNSPSHKENVLGDYSDIGFGIANSPSFQGGENTVVVAHYGKPLPTTPVAATQTPTQTATTTPATPKAAPTATTSNRNVTQTPVAEQKPSTANEVASESPATPTVQASAQTQTKNVSAFEQLMSGKVSVAIIASIALISIAGVGFILTHRAFVKHLVQNGEKFVLHHPMIDASAIATTLGLIFTTTVGKLL